MPVLNSARIFADFGHLARKITICFFEINFGHLNIARLVTNVEIIQFLIITNYAHT